MSLSGSSSAVSSAPPFAAGGGRASPPPWRHRHTPRTEPPRILIVDDSAVMRSIVKNELAGGTYEIREARHGREALEIVRSGFQPDLITLDLEMPELGGFDTCAALYSPEFRSCFPTVPDGQVPVVFLTGSDNLADRRRGFELGAVDFLSKSFEPGALARLIQQTMHPDDRLRGVRILVVDDSQVVRRLVIKTLGREGVSVLEAADGLQAFATLCGHLSDIDLVLTDIEMPNMDGATLCSRIRRELGLVDIPVVFLTSLDQEARLEAFAAGATDCLVKPFTKEELLARLIVHVEKAKLSSRLRRTVGDLRSALAVQRDMLSTLSHDMRTPLSGIMGMADLLLDERGRPPVETENLELIKASGQMLLGLVDDILILGKQETEAQELDLHPLDLRDVLKQSHSLLRLSAEHKEQQLTVQCGASPSIIAGHPESLARIVNNLIGNALKFTARGGTIAVTLESSIEGGHVLMVRDNGVGISPEMQQRLFERYTPASRRGTAGEPGHGLGMVIVQRLVHAHGGSIAVESEPGRGTIFRVTFPAVREETAEFTTSVIAARPGDQWEQFREHLQGCHVLLADDNPVNRSSVRTILEKALCTVEVVSGGQGALDAFLAAPKSFQALLLDSRMPDIDGPTVARRLRETGHHDVPIIGLVSGFIDAESALCREAGMGEIVVKPVQASALLGALARACEAR